MQKVKHDKNFRLEYKGKCWIVDLSEWHDNKTGKRQLRAYRNNEDIIDPDYQKALDREAAVRARRWRME